MGIFDIFAKKEEKAVTSRQIFLMINGQLGNFAFSSLELAREGYIRNIIAYRCITLIANQMSMIDYDLFQNDNKVEKHPLLDLLKTPYPTMAQAEFLISVASQLLIYGQAFLWMRYPTAEQNKQPQTIPPQLLYPLRPDQMRVQNGNNFLPAFFEFNQNDVTGETTTQTLKFNVGITGKSNIIHLKKFNPLNEFIGLSPTAPAFQSILQHNSSTNWNYSLLKNGGRPSGALMVPGDKTLNPDDIELLKKELDLAHSGSNNAGKPMLLTGGLEWIPMGMNAIDMDFSNTEKSAAHKIGLAYSVPMQLLNTDQSKFENLSVAYEQLWDEAILPLVNQYITELNMTLVPRYGNNLVLKFNSDRIQATMIKKARMMESVNKITFITINEKREKFGFEPRDDGDVFPKVGTNRNVTATEKDSFIERQIKDGATLAEANKLADNVYG